MAIISIRWEFERIVGRTSISPQPRSTSAPRKRSGYRLFNFWHAGLALQPDGTTTALFVAMMAAQPSTAISRLLPGDFTSEAQRRRRMAQQTLRSVRQPPIARSASAALPRKANDGNVSTYNQHVPALTNGGSRLGAVVHSRQNHDYQALGYGFRPANTNFKSAERLPHDQFRSW